MKKFIRLSAFWTAGIVGIFVSISTHAAFIAPAGLLPGQQFRVVVVTDTSIEGSSPDVATYDAAVQANIVAAGLDSYAGNPVAWQALVSTPTVAANSRLPADNVPIYLADGTQVASGSQALYDTANALLMHSISLTPLGATLPLDVNVGVWTGSNTFGNALLALGNTQFSTATRGLIATDTIWIMQNNFYPQTTLFHLYGFSPVLTVQAVPEPESLSLMVLACLALARRMPRRSERASALTGYEGVVRRSQRLGSRR